MKKAVRLWSRRSCGIMVVFLTALGLLVFFTNRENDWLEKAYKQIGLGMTDEQVHALFGRPAGDYSSDQQDKVLQVGPQSLSSQFLSSGQPGYLRTWKSNSGGAEIVFSPEGKVVKKASYSTIQMSSPAERLWHRITETIEKLF